MTREEHIENIIAHAGTLGQRWGRRLYQNPDGTYTELGKVRKRQYYRDNYSEYSNEQLKAMTERNNAISNYEKSLSSRNANAIDELTKEDNYRTNVVTNRQKKITSTSAGIKSLTGILTGSIALVAAGAAFMKAFNKDGKGTEDLKTIGKEFKENAKAGYAAIENLFKAKHSDIDEGVLMHHGIRGQKWGVRRYQNPDGTLTSLGRKRYGVKNYNDLTPVQKRDIARRDKALAEEDEKREKTEFEREQIRAEIKSDKRKDKLEAQRIRAEERLEKADIKASVEAQHDAQITSAAEKSYKRIEKGVAIVGALFAGATIASYLYSGKKAYSSDTKDLVSIKKNKIDDVVKDAVKAKKVKGKKWGKVAVEVVRESGEVNTGKAAVELFRDRDGVFKTAADIIKNHPGTLGLPA